MLGGFATSNMALAAMGNEKIISGCFNEAEGAFAFAVGAAFCLAGGAVLEGGFFLAEAAFAAMG